MSGPRPKFWRQSFWGSPILSTGTAFNQESTNVLFALTGETLIRSRVDISLVSQVTQSAAMLQYDQYWFAYVQMFFGLYLVDGDGSGDPPMLNDSGGLGINWVLWDSLYPTDIQAPTGANGFTQVVRWECNGGVTLDGAGRRGPFSGANPNVTASLGFFDPHEMLIRNPGTFNAGTNINIGVKCLFESAVAM